MNKEEKEQIIKDKTYEIADAIKGIVGNNSISVSLRPKKIPRTLDFVMIYQEVGKRILEGNISLTTSKVFFYLILNMSFENFIGINQNSISENINMPLRSVSRAMKELRECGIIVSIKDNFDSRRNIYRLNPIIAWKGKVINKIKMIKENPNQIKMFNNNE